MWNRALAAHLSVVTLPSSRSDSGSNCTLEMAHVLFMDIVAYSRLPMDEQHQALLHLQEAVRETREFARAQASDQLIRLPTGDGMALVFLGDVEAPVRCALELHRILRRWPEMQLRMGIHTGPVYRVEDINAARNVAGGGINHRPSGDGLRRCRAHPDFEIRSRCARSGEHVEDGLA